MAAHSFEVTLLTLNNADPCFFLDKNVVTAKMRMEVVYIILI